MKYFQLCVQKLGVLIEDSDQNLKYLGLLAMGRILQTHPKAVQAHKDIVLRCLDDKDESIRLRYHSSLFSGSFIQLLIGMFLLPIFMESFFVKWMQLLAVLLFLPLSSHTLLGDFILLSWTFN